MKTVPPRDACRTLRLAVAGVLVAVAGCSTPSRTGSATAPDRSTTVPPPTTTTAPPPTPSTAPTGFAATVSMIDAATAARMQASWRPGCPVPLERLRLLTVTHWDFDDQLRPGELVVHMDHAESIVEVFRALFVARFPIQQIRLVDDYGGDDNRSMAANNTSAFNCQPATGSSRWSEHAYGRAIDINPIQNPYVTRSGAVLPTEGAPYAVRDAAVQGSITDDGPVVAAFDAIGWHWGGRWSSGKDYQHFSATGR